MYYGSVQIAMNSCYNSNLLQLIKSPFREKAMFKVKRFIQIKLTLESLKQVIYFFPKWTTFSEIYPGHPHKNILKFEKYIQKLSYTTTEAKQ